MIGRADVERAIADEESTIEQVMGLLESKSDFARWPDEVRAALALALDDRALARAEGWKVVTLRRHLFGADAVVPSWLTAPSEPSPAVRRLAERMRAALPALVRFRAGRYLLASGAGGVAPL